MQNPNKHFSTSHYDAPVWAEWMRPNRANNSSWDSSLVASFSNDSDEASDVLEGSTPATAIPVEYTWTPPTPTLDSDNSSSQLSIESPSLSELDELPEIPFISTADALESDNDEDDTQYDFNAVGNTVDERTFWANLMRPNLTASAATGRRATAVLGQTNQRVLSANRCRSPSVSSTASSRSKPPPAKSILSSSSSIRTRKGRKPPSVKFLDAPTIHYESDTEDDESEFEQPYGASSDKSQAAAPQTGLFGFIRRIVGTSSGKSRAPDRPVISGPIPLWEGSRRRARLSLDESRKRTPSLRTTRSSASLRSERSCSSRLQTYWGRVTGKDP
ncbi:hypothetical protein EUX98_g5759 [Antrodiella citrinella]|uniref:Uncharacterized protein n=1 Tax=Antrodiella citrinella TaxID=2447956 RepID=A0A4S4MQN1_9APHY|nr:hypothetical protein EUX98_g5759 [Antrodiella citrinella]